MIDDEQQTPAEATSAQPESPSLDDRFRAAFPSAERAVAGWLPTRPGDALRALADEADALDEPESWDRYGQRGPVAVLEQQIAELLGKPAAVMFPSGVMAQQSVLRIWTDRAGCARVALPDLSHLLLHELDGPRLLHGFRFEPLTHGAEVPTADHLAKVPGRLAAVLVELPLRDGGYLLPSWDQLVELSEACRARDVRLHVDGARLWESQPAWGHSLAEIAGLADSVYVSFYKGLRGMAGAAVACDAEVAAELRHWRTRHGGTLMTLLPYAVAALRGLREELPRMAQLHEHACRLAAALAERGLRTLPEPPHTNAFRLFAPGAPDELFAKVVAVLEAERVVVTGPWSPSDVPGWSWTEIVVGPPTLDWTVDEAADLLTRTLAD